MKIIDKIAQKNAEGTPFYSFEYFPPKTAQVSEDLFAHLLQPHNYTIFTSGPSFFSSSSLTRAFTPTACTGLYATHPLKLCSIYLDRWLCAGGFLLLAPSGPERIGSLQLV